ncbi:sulfite:cytochrome C oxidoreductase subunit B [bacterium]|nr:sulfite:cytochrome C oxidoreductase subunit B [bacterium]MBU1989104.1 sulfite:cytochrome C oxidoreductase subunit B [bacterium]
MKKIVLIAVLSFTSAFAQVEEPVEVPFIPYEIKMGKGFDAIQANCLMCHSFGYIINQGRQSKDFWNKKVLKMVIHFKAPISKEDVEITTDYLFEHYGNGELK